MAAAEHEHGGPRTLTSSDVWDLLDEQRVTTPTINRALRELEHVGVVREMPGRPNGYRLWQLAPSGRAKYGLPNEHVRPAVKRILSMSELTRGSVWQSPTGRKIEVLDWAFIWAGKRWVVVDNRDYSDDGPVVMGVQDIADGEFRKVVEGFGEGDIEDIQDGAS